VHLVSIENVIDIPADIDHCHGCLDAGERRRGRKGKSRCVLERRDGMTMHILRVRYRRLWDGRLRDNVCGCDAAERGVYVKAEDYEAVCDS
jgi:hypothetical protein